MDRETAYNKAFDDPDNAGFLYSDAKNALVKESSVEDTKRTRQKCEFWTRTEFDGKFEEKADFSVEESDVYVRELPEIDSFTEVEYRIVNDVSRSECSSCSGTGNYCSDCNGTGRKSCSCMDGYERKSCSNCNGSGKVEVIDSNLDERNIQCGDCDGSGRQKSIHSRCNGRGELKCKTCLDGSRDVECEDCDGTGTVTLINATSVRYRTSENVSERTPEEVEEADHYYINPKESHWNTVHQETFGDIPESGNGNKKPTDQLLLPVPDGDNLKIRFTREEIPYEKLNFVLHTSELRGEYEDGSVEHTAWKVNGNSRIVDKIDSDKVTIPAYVFTILYKFAFLGLWAGTILTLVLMLPLVAVSDYIIEIPENVLGVVAILIFICINLLVLWDTVVTDRYNFSI